jgi:hypothetical protein
MYTCCGYTVVREQLESRRKAETAAIEEKKNAHIESLMEGVNHRIISVQSPMHL